MTAFASNILAALPGFGAKIGAGQAIDAAGGQGGFEAVFAALLANAGAALDEAQLGAKVEGEAKAALAEARPATADQTEQPDAALLGLLLAAAAPAQPAPVQAQPAAEGEETAVEGVDASVAVQPDAQFADALPEAPAAPAAAAPVDAEAPVVAGKVADVAPEGAPETVATPAAASITAAPEVPKADALDAEAQIVRAEPAPARALREEKTAGSTPARERATAAAQPAALPEAPLADAAPAAPAETAPDQATAPTAPPLPEAARVLAQPGVTSAVARVVEPKASDASVPKVEAPAAAAPDTAQAEAPVEVAAPVTAFAVAEAAAETAQPTTAPVVQAAAVAAPAPAKPAAPVAETRRGVRSEEANAAPNDLAAAPKEKAAVATDAPVQRVAAIAPEAADDAAPAPVVADEASGEPVVAALETHVLPEHMRVQADTAAAVRGSPETVAKLAADITRKLEGQNTRFDLQLDPLGLGKVDVSIEINADGRLTAALSFDSAAAADALRGRQAELRQALQQAGFEVADNGLSFDLSGQGAGFGGRQADEQPQAWSSRAFRTTQADLDEADALKAAASTYSRTPTGGVDIRI